MVDERGGKPGGVGQLERVQPLAQHRFDRRLPAVVDAQLLPQARGLREPVALRATRGAARCPRLRPGSGAACRAAPARRRARAAPRRALRRPRRAALPRRRAPPAGPRSAARHPRAPLSARCILYRAARLRFGERLQLGFEPLAALLERLQPRSRCASSPARAAAACSACESALRAASRASCAARSACSACGSSARARRRASCASAPRGSSLPWRARPTRAAMGEARALAAPCESTCARRSVCWLSSRWRVSSACRSSDSRRATSAFAA